MKRNIIATNCQEIRNPKKENHLKRNPRKIVPFRKNCSVSGKKSKSKQKKVLILKILATCLPIRFMKVTGLKTWHSAETILNS
jgi:hypothetical protein